MLIYTEIVKAPDIIALAPLARIMQDASLHDIDKRGAGFADLQANGVTWVLTQLNISVSRYPMPGEELVAATWPTVSHLGMYPRRYELRDMTGAAIIRMHGIWVVMDMSARTLVSFAHPGIDIGETDPEKLRPRRRIHIPTGGTVTQFSPEPHQIDVNRHLNNTAYIELTERALPDMPHSVQIDFEHEILFGETVELRCVHADDGFYFDGRTEKPCFKAFLR